MAIASSKVVATPRSSHFIPALCPLVEFKLNRVSASDPDYSVFTFAAPPSRE
jgi:hypothetical protein